MTVRAKFSCNYAADGVRGRSLSFGAVYEGSNELQALSENFIFGKASPSGSADLAGIGLERFEQGEEYYFDFRSVMDAQKNAAAEDADALLITAARKVFRSTPNPNWPDAPDQFRFIIGGPGELHAGSFSIGIANKNATNFLDGYEDMQLVIKVARGGRRSDEEIAIRQKMLDEARTNNPTATGWIAQLEKKLTRAKGET